MSDLFLSSGTAGSTGNLVYSSPNTFTFKIPGGNYPIKSNTKVSVSALSMSNSFRNITSAFNNNTFTITYNGVSNVITIPDGSYNISDINGYLQTQLDNFGWYLVKPDGSRAYFIVFQVNSTLYTITISLLQVPSSLTGSWLNYTNPAGLALTGLTPTVTIPATNIRTLLGINAGTFPATPQATNQYLNSNTVPSLSNYSIIHLCMKGACNNVMLNSNPEIIFSFSPNQSSGNVMFYNTTNLSLIPV